MEIVSRPHARALVAFAAAHPEVIVLSADLTSSCEANELRDQRPHQFLSLGMAEQNLLSFAGGLAREGLTPFVHTFSVFLTRRAYDQVAMSVAYPNLRVRLVGFLPGLTTPGGVTHQAIDDIGLMRLLPNMTVLECADATEVEGALEAAQAVDGPVYLRMLRGDVPRLFPRGHRIVPGRACPLATGGDLLLVSSGHGTEEATRARLALTRRGLSVGHLHVNSHKPFDREALCAALTPGTPVVSVENHTVVGGLGSAVAEVLAEEGLPCRLVRLGLQDTYAHGASKKHLFREYSLDASAVVRAAGRLLGASFDVDPAELDGLDPQAAATRVEDL